MLFWLGAVALYLSVGLGCVFAVVDDVKDPPKPWQVAVVMLFWPILLVAAMVAGVLRG